MRLYVAAVLLLSSLAAGSVWWFTPLGLGVYPDSVQYIEFSQALRSGQIPPASAPQALSSLTRFPPGFSIILALLPSGGEPVYKVARPLFAAVAALNVLLMGALLGCVCRRKALALSLLTLGISTIAFVRQHLLLYSEPFLLLAESGILLAALPLGAWQHRSGVQTAGSLAAAAAGLLRYAGAAFPPSAAIVSILRRPAGLKNSVAGAALYLVALLPVGAWMWFVHEASKTLGGREFRLPAFTLETFNRLVYQITSILIPLPESFSRGAAIAGCYLVCALLLAAGFHTRAGRACLIFLTFYLALVVGSFLFLDAAIPFNDRLLLPLLPLCLIVIGASLDLAAPRFVLIAIIGIISLAAYSVLSVSAPFLQASREGIGFAQPRIAASPIFERLKGLPKDAIIYSNYPELIVLHAQRTAVEIPPKIDPGSGELNRQLPAQIAEMRVRSIGNDQSYVVWFTAFRWRTYHPDFRNLVDVLRLRGVEPFDVGGIYDFEP